MEQPSCFIPKTTYATSSLHPHPSQPNSCKPPLEKKKKKVASKVRVAVARILLRIIRQIRVINVSPSSASHLANARVVPVEAPPQVHIQLPVLGIPRPPRGVHAFGVQVEAVGFLERPVGEADEVPGAVDEEGVDLAEGCGGADVALHDVVGFLIERDRVRNGTTRAAGDEKNMQPKGDKGCL